MIIESCIESLEQALRSERAGAQRLELCADLGTGGLSPSPELLNGVLRAVRLPVMAMVRLRAGNFCYSPRELEEMLLHIRYFKDKKVLGVVFGCLLPDGKVDVAATRLLCEAAHPLQVTFHKAIDETPDPIEALRSLMEVGGVHRVLTSGGAATALEGQGVLREMLRVAGDSISVLVAGRVTKENLAEVHQAIGAEEYHGRRIVF